jgi:hypothetical protein
MLKYYKIEAKLDPYGNIDSYNYQPPLLVHESDSIHLLPNQLKQ